MSQKLQSWTLPKEHISCGLHPEPYKSSPDHTKLGPPHWAQISQSGPAVCQKAGGPRRCVGWSWLLSQLLWLVKLVWSEIENTHSLVGERHSATLEDLFLPREKKTPSQIAVSSRRSKDDLYEQAYTSQESIDCPESSSQWQYRYDNKSKRGPEMNELWFSPDRYVEAFQWTSS